MFRKNLTLLSVCSKDCHGPRVDEIRGGKIRIVEESRRSRSSNGDDRGLLSQIINSANSCLKTMWNINDRYFSLHLRSNVIYL